MARSLLMRRVMKTTVRLGFALVVATTFSLASTACVTETPDSADSVDLPLGERLDADKADGTWGAALTCKPIPSLPTLANPEITVSLNGLTLRLRDRTTGFDKVFPVGVGAVDAKSTSSTYGESLSYYPIQATGKNAFVITPASIQPCKTWWTDSATGQKSPVFAGLPFMAFYGGYGLHGPIDNFRAANGGNLRRGFVSHGCIRMESTDILEVYARTRGARSIPVRVQREPEREPSGQRVDVTSRWVGAECGKDSDCGFTGSLAPGGARIDPLCKANRLGGRGFCTLRCEGACPDRVGAPSTFCATDPDDATRGFCTLRTGGQLPDCRALDHFVARTVSRFRNTTVRASVCMPGSPGWIGDRCLGASDCRAGLRCSGAAQDPGVCTQACTRACPDAPGFPSTTCANQPAGGSACARRCTTASNASECAANQECVSRSRPGNTAATVCSPR